MEVGGVPKELNMTADEVDRMKKALKDEKFREMLHDYVQELSDPENKKRYEEEITRLEQERGNTIEFIHPEPFKVLRTSLNGKQKCFINICANGKVGKPSSSWGVSEEGRRGQRWSLPHSLHPGRQDSDPKGNKIMIYDVIFHPDTVHIASKNKRFMDMVDSTAIQGIQQAFNVTLDQNNVRAMTTKYKGTPQPCVIRKPIPGFTPKEPSEKPDPLAFPYPDDKIPATSLQSNPTELPATKHSSELESFKIQPKKIKEPTKPNHTVKYRSFIELQDFRCSRDSAQSPRPKELVVTIDVPLLKTVADASLEVKERSLLLECKKAAYRLELPLTYPVDEDNGEAKFNKERGQLTVTLQVLPSDEAFDYLVGPAQQAVSDDERQGERSEMEDTWEEEERRKEEEEEERDTREDNLKQQIVAEKGEEEQRGQEKEKVQMMDREEEIRVVEEAQQVQKGQESMEEKQENEKEEDTCIGIELSEDKCDRAAEKNDSDVASVQCDSVDQWMTIENNPALITTEHSGCIRKELEPTARTEDGNLKVETNVSALNDRSSEVVSYVSGEPESQINVKGIKPDKMPAADDPSDTGVTLCSEDFALGCVREEREDIDEDDLPTEQVLQNTKDNKPPPVLLREIDKDGKEKIINDHSTSAGFIFQNSLMFELD